MGMLPRIRGGFFRRGERAQTTTEFVVVFPMLLLLFFLMLEFGWLLKNWVVVTNGPREATRCAIANNCTLDGTYADPETLMLSRLSAGITGNLVDIETDIHFIDGGTLNGIPDPGESIVVCVRAGNKAITPLLVFTSMAGVLPDPMPLAAREEMIIEFVNLSDPDWATFWGGLLPGGENCVSS